MNRKPRVIAKTDLILNPDGSIYHLNLRPEDVADTIILVGDPERVPLISARLDNIEIKKCKREYVTHTGRIGKKRISVISTGIGIGNIDIVINELDALVNIDFKTYTVKKKHTHLNIIRIGTCGALIKELEPGAFVLSTAAISFDGLLLFYNYHPSKKEKELLTEVNKHFATLPTISNAYLAQASPSLLKLFRGIFYRGITLTCIGFYGPQYRKLHAPLLNTRLLDLASQFNFKGERIANFEMETAGIFALARLLHHEHASVSLVVANRITEKFSTQPEKDMNTMIDQVLEIIS